MLLRKASSKGKLPPSLNSVFILTLKSNIVLVPGIGTALPESWPFANEEWLSTLPGSGVGACIFAYEYASPFAGANYSWESVLMLGYDLLQHLSDARSQPDPDMVCELEWIRSA